MNICLVTPYYRSNEFLNSGIANYFYNLSEELSKRGHKVVVLFVSERNIDVNSLKKLENNNIKIYYQHVSLPGFINYILKNRWAVKGFLIRFVSCFITYFKLNSIVKKHEIEIIETTSTNILCIINILLKSDKPKYIVRVSTLHKQMYNEYYTFKSRLLNLLSYLEILMINQSKYLITNTYTHLDEISKIINIDKSRFKIINHGIEIPKLSNINLIKNDLNLRILFVGRFEYRKGFDLILKVIPKVLKYIKNCKFILVGTDVEKDFYNEEFVKLKEKYQDYIITPGVVSNEKLKDLYLNADIVLAPSRYESFGLVYIEAMSYAKPLIALNTGSAVEIINKNNDGFLIENESVDNFSDLIIRLSKDKLYRNKIGQNARNNIINNYSNEKIVDESINYYESII